MSKTKSMFGSSTRKKDQLKEQVEGEQGQMFSREKKVDAMTEKTEKIGGERKKIKSLFQRDE